MSIAPSILIIDGRPMLQPQLPRWAACGGMQAPYYPALTHQQLQTILTHPEVTRSARKHARRELTKRRNNQRAVVRP